MSLRLAARAGWSGGRCGRYPGNCVEWMLASCPGRLAPLAMGGLVVQIRVLLKDDIAIQVVVDLVVLALQFVEGALHNHHPVLLRVLVLDRGPDSGPGRHTDREGRERAGAEAVPPVEVVIVILMLSEPHDGHSRF